MQRLSLVLLLAAVSLAAPAERARPAETPGGAPRPELCVPAAHGPYAHGMAWSPDGKTLATWQADLAILWEVESGLPNASLPHGSGGDDWIESGAWSPDGATFATQARESVLLWETATGRLRARLPGAGACVAWSTDGRTLATGTARYADDAVLIWDPGTGEMRRRLADGPGKIRSLHWSPDGKSLAGCSWEGGATVWNSDTWRHQLIIGSIHGPVAWRPAAASWQIAGWGTDRRTGVWDARSGLRLVSFSSGAPGPNNAWMPWESAHAFAWRPDGGRLAVRHAGQIALWDPESGKRAATLRAPEEVGAASHLVWARDGRTLLSSHARGLMVWDTDGASVLARLPEAARDLVANPAADQFATEGERATAVIRDLPGANVVARLRNRVAGLNHLAWSPEGRVIATDTGWPAPRVVFWDLPAGRPRFLEQPLATEVTALRWSPDGRCVAVETRSEESLLFRTPPAVTLVDPASARRRAALADAAGPSAWNPDGSRLATLATLAGPLRGYALLWDANGGQRALLEGARFLLAWSPDGKTLATDAGPEEEEAVLLWDFATRQLRGRLSPRAGTFWPTALAWSPDSSLLVGLSRVGTGRLWHAPTRELRDIVEGHTTQMTGVAWRPDGTRFATATADSALSGNLGHTILLWDGRSGKSIAALRGHQGPVHALAWSPGGDLLATASGGYWTTGLHGARAFDPRSRDRRVLVWDGESGALRRRLVGHTGPIQKLAWSPDGKGLATAARDGTVRLWDPRAPDEARAALATLPGPGEKVQEIGWSADGRFLTALGRDAVGLWTAAGKPLVTLYAFDGGTEWLAATLDGRFAGSEGAIRLLRWREGARLWPVERHRKQYERPGLLRELFTQ